MRRHAIVFLLLSLAVVPTRAGIPTDNFTIDAGQTSYLTVTKGELVVGKATLRNSQERRPAPERWLVLGTKIKSSVEDRYLAYDASGKDPRVFLTSVKGEGTEWIVSVPDKSRDSEGKRVHLQAASGPMKGWYLCLEGGRAVLSKDAPKRFETERLFDHL
jgi:hypothetical protein